MSNKYFSFQRIDSLSCNLMLQFYILEFQICKKCSFHVFFQGSNNQNKTEKGHGFKYARYTIFTLVPRSDITVLEWFKILLTKVLKTTVMTASISTKSIVYRKTSKMKLSLINTQINGLYSIIFYHC